MSRDILPLSKEKWQGYELEFRYETAHYYDADIKQDSSGFYASFIKKPFPAPITKDFKDKLFPNHWEGAQVFGIFENEQLIACLEIWKEDWSNRLRVTELWVDEKHRRQGIGKKLMDLAKNKAQELGCRALILETQSCNEKAIAFYLSQGLSLFGFDRSCYGNNDVGKCEVRIELGMYLYEMNISYRQLNKEDIHPEILKDFNRYQEVNKCWRKQNGEWVLVDNHFIDDWDEAKKKELAIVYLPGTIERGGTVFGAYDGEKLIGFFALAGNFIGSQKQYLRLISLQVSHEYRHKGIGKKLFSLCVDAAIKYEAEKLYISAHSSQESQAFYRAMRCVDTEEIIPELFEAEPFDVHMEFVLLEKERTA
ncbi:GNAT family N-acetyltransferase [Eubacteriales bacterium OttesenSCG-928-G02]|nr:GNAT family N-acetyltransferase [Eubacteriales bacterium OttesenSCG-928-G02]